MDVAGFVALTGTALVVLAALGRLGDVVGLPPEFAAVAASLDSDVPQEEDGDAYVGFLVGAGLGVVVFVALQVLRFRRTRAVLLGDVEPLIPRDGHEQLASLPLCLNAGFSEELRPRPRRPGLRGRARDHGHGRDVHVAVPRQPGPMMG